MMDAQELYERMKKVQEAKGYYFNKDKERTFELLEALLVNKERYGYMGCPCRLVGGDREAEAEFPERTFPPGLPFIPFAVGARGSPS